MSAWPGSCWAVGHLRRTLVLTTTMIFLLHWILTGNSRHWYQHIKEAEGRGARIRVLSPPPLGSPALCCDTAQHPECGFPTVTWTSPRSSHSRRLPNERPVQPGSYQSILRWRVGLCNYTRSCKKNCTAKQLNLKWQISLRGYQRLLERSLHWHWNLVTREILSWNVLPTWYRHDRHWHSSTPALMTQPSFYPWVLCFYSVILEHLEGRGSCSTLDLQLFSTQGWHIRSKYMLNKWKYSTSKEKQTFHCHS